MKFKVLTVGMVIGAMLFIVGGVTGCSSCGLCSSGKTTVKQCTAGADKATCAKKATAKKCGPNCTKPCCAKKAQKSASCPMK